MTRNDRPISKEELKSPALPWLVNPVILPDGIYYDLSPPSVQKWIEPRFAEDERE